jgi:hypothetical protein
VSSTITRRLVSTSETIQNAFKAGSNWQLATSYLQPSNRMAIIQTGWINIRMTYKEEYVQ